MSREQSAAEAGDRAIGFWVKLTSGEATDADHAACAAWRAADPVHEHAWARLQQGLSQSVGRLETVMKNEHHAATRRAHQRAPGASPRAAQRGRLGRRQRDAGARFGQRGRAGSPCLQGGLDCGTTKQGDHGQ
ncbi:DUF4880 domain-containing protein [Achromobacter sp.]|uniref:DUF4880 domain-containing protein n=1 Tax=Achromobacter sp. TaxID=134375 RepID=UPI0031DB84B6